MGQDKHRTDKHRTRQTKNMWTYLGQVNIGLEKKIKDRLFQVYNEVKQGTVLTPILSYFGYI